MKLYLYCTCQNIRLTLNAKYLQTLVNTIVNIRVPQYEDILLMFV